MSTARQYEEANTNRALDGAGEGTEMRKPPSASVQVRTTKGSMGAWQVPAASSWRRAPSRLDVLAPASSAM